jgi:hypothetical protein
MVSRKKIDLNKGLKLVEHHVPPMRVFDSAQMRRLGLKRGACAVRSVGRNLSREYNEAAKRSRDRKRLLCGGLLSATTHAAGVSGIPVLYKWCATLASGVRFVPS